MNKWTRKQSSARNVGVDEITRMESGAPIQEMCKGIFADNAVIGSASDLLKAGHFF